MLTSFFGKSKPAHFLILGVLLVLGFVWTLYTSSFEANGADIILYKALQLTVILFSIILLDFIIGKNHLTQKNGYAIFFFSCFMVMLPAVFLNSEVLLANFFLLLALRRIISLRNDTNSDKKIVDTAIWTTIASLFYFYSLLFFIPLFIATIQKPNLRYKQLLIPIVGFIAVLVINTAYHLVVTDSFSWLYDWHQNISFNFSVYNSLTILIPVTLILTLLVFTVLFRWRSLSSILVKEKSNYMVFLIILFTTLTIAICGADKDGSEMLFLFAPTAILCANYIETRENKGYQKADKMEFWFKESLLCLVVLFAFIFLFL